MVGELFGTNSALTFEINGIAGAVSDMDVRLLDAVAGPKVELNWTSFWWEREEPVVSGSILSPDTFAGLRASLAARSEKSRGGDSLGAARRGLCRKGPIHRGIVDEGLAVLESARLIVDGPID